MVQLIPCEFFQISQNSIFVEQLPANTFRDNINLKNPASLQFQSQLSKSIRSHETNQAPWQGFKEGTVQYAEGAIGGDL